LVSQGVNLSGKVAMLIGAGGWYPALALALAEAGADIALVTPASDGMELAEQVQRLGVRAMLTRASLTDSRELENAVTATIARWGHIEVLVNSADLEYAKPLLEMGEDEWHRVLSTNLTSVFLCCKAVGKHMVERGRGRIINITSVLAMRGLANAAAYCASHSGVLGMTRALALEWARHGVRVNAVGVGWFSGSPLAEGLRPRLERYIPLRSLGQPEDLTSLVVYLASDASDFVTGAAFFVDGGILAHG